MIIRAAAEKDFAAIAAIYGEAVRNGYATFELEAPDEAELVRRWRSLLEGGYPYLIAMKDATVLGYAYAGPYRARPAYRFSVENTVYVAPHAQRQGVGRALLEELIVETEARDFRQMIAVISAPVESGSVALHAAVGFTEVGTLKAVGYKHDGWRDTVIMQRPLGHGPGAVPDEEKPGH